MAIFVWCPRKIHDIREGHEIVKRNRRKNLEEKQHNVWIVFIYSLISDFFSQLSHTQALVCSVEDTPLTFITIKVKDAEYSRRQRQIVVLLLSTTLVKCHVYFICHKVHAYTVCWVLRYGYNCEPSPQFSVSPFPSPKSSLMFICGQVPSPHLAPGNCQSAFHLYSFAFSKNFM